MTAVVFVVPGQPQAKGRARIGRAGAHARMFSPPKTVAYEGIVALAAQQAMAGRPLLVGAVTVTVTMRCQVPQSWSAKKRALALRAEIMPTTKPDVDNCLKALFDGCNGVVWHDDVQVVIVTATKCYAAEPGVTMIADELGSGDKASI